MARYLTTRSRSAPPRAMRLVWPGGGGYNRRLMIILKDIALRRGSRLLLSGASVSIRGGEHLALIGANGSGKSSLFALLLGELVADQGEIEGADGLRLSHMAQEAPATSQAAGDYVLAGDRELHRLVTDIAGAETSGDFERAAQLHSAMEQANGYDVERRVQRLLQGLGFEQGAHLRPVNDFSGGWRIRLNLARALMTPSDLLLLDEPTNHLDLDATLWLQQWLTQYPGTLLMISHDRDFIDATCSRVLHIEQCTLHSYRGNYSAFEQQRLERLANQQASYEKQQHRIARIEDFVRRFRYKATKAKQAQSRLKELERMQAMAPAHVDSPFDFSFPDPGRSSDPLLVISAAELGYDGQPVLSEVEIRLRPGSRLGLLGRNGAGKSTLLKSLVGDLPLLAGERVPGEHCRIGYFDQQQLEALDLAASPLLHLQRLDRKAREQHILDFLGGFNFRGEQALDPIAPLSGGEKARLALAITVWQRPNLLILDEPTNHLDLDMCHALEVALQGFEGALVLVSHDRHLLRNTVDELLLVHDGRVDDYSEDLQAYERWLLSGIDNRQETGPEAATPAGETTRKAQRQQAAARRQQLRPLRQQIERTEARMATLESDLAQLQERLANPELYEGDRKTELPELLRRQGELRSEAARLEEHWLAQQEQLEQLEAGS